MALPPFQLMSLFSGVGGLDLGIKIALPPASVVAHVEREAYAASDLVARMEDTVLDQAPIWDDVSTFDGRPWRGVVDCIAGGFPCQDISTAGKQEGIRVGNRSGLWFEFARIIGEVGPGLVFVENVSALTLPERGFDAVLGSLSDLGYDAEWLTLAASDVGATHQRERIFLLAYRQGERLGKLRESLWTEGSQGGLIDRRDEGLADAGRGQLPDEGRGSEGRAGTDKSSEGLAHPEHQGPSRPGAAGGSPATADDARGPDVEVAHTERGGAVGERDADQPAAGCEGLADAPHNRLRVGGNVTGKAQDAAAGLPDRSGQGLADSGGSRLPPPKRSALDAARESSEGCGNLADAAELEARPGVGGDPQGKGCRRGRHFVGGPELADTNLPSASRLGQFGGRGQPETDESGRRSDQVGDAERAGFQRGGSPEQARRRQPGASGADGADVPLFPPGPGDFDGWGRVVAHGSYDGRAPAVKPGLRVLVDRVALVVDTSRADQLRCAGNGVVAIQAAVAFTELVRRMSVTLEAE